MSATKHDANELDDVVIEEPVAFGQQGNGVRPEAVFAGRDIDPQSDFVTEHLDDLALAVDRPAAVPRRPLRRPVATRPIAVSRAA
jgi:hypothetical protein